MKGQDWSMVAGGDPHNLQIRGSPEKHTPRPPPPPTMNGEVISLCEVSLCEGCEDQHVGPPLLHAAYTEKAKTRGGRHLSQGLGASQRGLWTGTRCQFGQGIETL